MRSLSPLGLILASFCTAVAALHESDVGIIDWHQPHTGVPQTWSLSTAPTFHAKPGRPPTEALLLTATSSNVLAAVHASNGSLGACHLYHGYPKASNFSTAWRSIFEPSDNIVRYQKHREGTLLLLPTYSHNLIFAQRSCLYQGPVAWCSEGSTI